VGRQTFWGRPTNHATIHKDTEMKTHQNILLSGVVFAKEGLLSGAKSDTSEAPVEETVDPATDSAQANNPADASSPAPATDLFADSNQIERPILFPDGSRSGEPDESNGLAFTDEGFLEPVAAYKHRTVMRFQVGKFTFQNHILQIFSDSDNEEFLRLAQGLTPQDKTQIVAYNWRAAANVEKPMNFDSVSRGAVNTRSTKDPKSVQ
jgi:hypothetical protein